MDMKEMVPTIREAKVNEHYELSQIALDSKSYWGYSAEFMQACRDELCVTPEKITSDIFDHFVYELNCEIKGFYAIEKLNKREAELEALFVRSKYIGTGIGKALMKHALTYIKLMGCNSLIIQGDPHAEYFYLAMGAERIGEQESSSIAGRYLPVFKMNLDVN